MGPMREHRWVAVLYALVAVRVVERVAERSQLVARRGRAKVAIFLMSRFLADHPRGALNARVPCALSCACFDVRS